MQTQIEPTKRGVAEGNPSLFILTGGFAPGAETCNENDATIPAAAFILRKITTNLTGLGAPSNRFI